MAYNLVTKQFIYEKLRKKNCHPKKNKEKYIQEFKSVVLEFYSLDPVSLSDEASEILENQAQHFYKRMLDIYKAENSRWKDILQNYGVRVQKNLNF